MYYIFWNFAMLRDWNDFGDIMVKKKKEKKMRLGFFTSWNFHQKLGIHRLLTLQYDFR